MLLKRRQRPKNREEQLALKPVRAPAAMLDGMQIKIPIRGNWLFRPPKDARRKFELDEMGLFVWNRCDGQTSIEQVLTALAERYSISSRDAEVSTLKFLQMLARRGLIEIETKNAPRSD